MFSLATEHKLTGELTEVPLKHQCAFPAILCLAMLLMRIYDASRKPFFFSRVVPYDS